MSYRCCKTCDQVSDNRVWDDDYCQNCKDTNWLSPLDDERDWGQMYKDQNKELFDFLEKRSK